MFGKRKKQERKIGSAFDRLLNYTFKKDESIEPLMLLFIFGHKTFMDKTYNEA